MTKIRQLIDSKGHELWCVSPRESIYHALEVMSDHNLGSVLVKEGTEVVGIFTERDYARGVILQGKSSPNTPVSEVMTTEVICIDPEATVEDAMNIMTEKHMRHLPVMENDIVVGLVSIGDLVGDVISEQKKTIEQLEAFIRS